MTMINSRRLKIYTRYQTGTYKITTVSETRLKGKWLDKIGFKEGQMVNIEEKKNKLTITLDKRKK
ncbi:SymE family type I addiction module toxin [Chryseobacterium sp. OV279]|uniref:SymE family type I addiction module toxin n=1 Tax=Chryseobacterium sp. OV279 TaxID=1500285 RepID=UPI001E626361|nr:SymE family type I addiction module toxin [Chryseobacterium sp. OV279]